MIGRLCGRIVHEDADFVLVVDVAGVGYDVHAPLGTAGRAHKDAEGRVTLYVHTHVREEALALYGFASLEDRAAFRTLLTVSSIGPKSAVTILSMLPATELGRAIELGDVKSLTAVSGVGKRTAERILLELKGKILTGTGGQPTLPMLGSAPPSSPKSAPVKSSLSGQAAVLHSALVSMGYKAPEAERTVLALGDVEPDADLSTLLRRALAALSK